jgi:hypothetical protein
MGYICESTTIERIVTYVLGSGLTKFAGITVNPSKAADIGQALVKLNVRAFNARYHSTEPVPLYRHTTRTASNPQVLKSIVCLMAQCAEVMDDPVYLDLKTLRDSLALTVASTSAEYEKAEWA